VKRKPVLPPRKATLDENGPSQDSAAKSSEKNTVHVGEDELYDHVTQTSDAWANGDTTQSPVSDEFGPWRENSGAGLDAQAQPPHHAELQPDDGIRVTGVDAPVEEEETTTPVPPQKKKAPPPLPPRRPTQEHTNVGEIDAVHPNDAPPAQSVEEADAKFALGGDVGEEDFENASADDSVNDTKNSEIERGDVVEDSKGGEIVGIPAPVDDDVKEVQESAPRPESANSSKSEDLQSRVDVDGSTTVSETGHSNQSAEHL
jgi:hypothetical protein